MARQCCRANSRCWICNLVGDIYPVTRQEAAHVMWGASFRLFSGRCGSEAGVYSDPTPAPPLQGRGAAAPCPLDGTSHGAAPCPLDGTPDCLPRLRRICNSPALSISICNAQIGLQVLILVAAELQIRLSGRQGSGFFQLLNGKLVFTFYSITVP